MDLDHSTDAYTFARYPYENRSYGEDKEREQ